MKSYIHCLSFDFRAGSALLLLQCGLCVLVSFFVVIGGSLKASSLGIDSSQLTFGDNVLALLPGLLPPEPNNREAMPFPIGWFLVLAISCCIPLVYFSQSRDATALQVLLRSENRWSWFLSKCTWAISAASLYWALLFLSIAFFTLCFSGDMSFAANEGRGLIALSRFSALRDAPYDMLPFCIGASVVGVSLVAFVSAASLLIRPVPAYLVGLAFLLVPLMLSTGVFPGEYLMAVRYDAVITDGITVQQAAAFAGILLAVSIGVNGFLFAVRDIVKESDSDD